MASAAAGLWQRLAIAVAPKPVFVRYVSGMFLDVLRLVFAVVAGIEAIFVTDLVLSSVLPHVLDHRASLLNVVVMVGLTLPSGLFIALPIALLAGVYFVAIRRREAREFIVLAGTGRGVGPLVRFALLVGCAGLALSLFLSGYVEPLARHAGRVTMSDIRVEAIRNNALGAGKFYRFSDLAIFVGGGETDRAASKVFVLQDRGDDAFRLLVASRSWRLEEHETGAANLILSNAATYNFTIDHAAPQNASVANACVDCGALQVVPGSAHASQQILVNLPRLSLPPIDPRIGNISETTSLEMLGGDLDDARIRRELGERLLRGLLVLVAPLLALAAVALTRPGTFLLALPAAAGLTLGGSFFGPRLVEALARLSLETLTGVLAAGALLVMACCVGVIHRFRSGCIQNGGVQL